MKFMLTQRQIRKATREKMAGVKSQVARQNLLAARDVEIAAFMLQPMDLSRFQAKGQ